MTTNKFIYIGVALIMLAGSGLGIYFAFKAYHATFSTEIRNFEECASAGYLVMKSLPEQCRTPDGRIFTRTMDAPIVIDYSSNVRSAVQAKAAQDLGTTSEAVAILSMSPRDWPDGCLGLRKADEGCIQVITSGYEVVIEVKGKTSTYRTNHDGSVVRYKN